MCMLLLWWFVPSKVGAQGKELLKYGGRGRSRTHQALSQPLTGFEDQAPHRGRRSSSTFKAQYPARDAH